MRTLHNLAHDGEGEDGSHPQVEHRLHTFHGDEWSQSCVCDWDERERGREGAGGSAREGAGGREREGGKEREGRSGRGGAESEA